MWVVNTLIFYLAAMILPASFVLGNNLFTSMQAAVVSGLILTIVSWLVDPFARLLEWDMKAMPNMMVAYFAGNVATVWFIARYSMLSGFGVANVLWVLILSVVTFVGQYTVAAAGMGKKK